MMNSLYTLTAVICSSAIICTILSNFVTESGTKKILNLILGAFMVCSLIVPVKNAVSEINTTLDGYDTLQEITSTADEAYSNEVISLTEDNLEQALSDMLKQNGIEINDSKIILALSNENRIIISYIGIYISKEYTLYTELISEIVYDNFTVVPNIMME